MVPPYYLTKICQLLLQRMHSSYSGLKAYTDWLIHPPANQLTEQTVTQNVNPKTSSLAGDACNERVEVGVEKAFPQKRHSNQFPSS